MLTNIALAKWNSSLSHEQSAVPAGLGGMDRHLHKPAATSSSPSRPRPSVPAGHLQPTPPPVGDRRRSWTASDAGRRLPDHRLVVMACSLVLSASRIIEQSIKISTKTVAQAKVYAADAESLAHQQVRQKAAALPRGRPLVNGAQSPPRSTRRTSPSPVRRDRLGARHRATPSRLRSRRWASRSSRPSSGTRYPTAHRRRNVRSSQGVQGFPRRCRRRTTLQLVDPGNLHRRHPWVPLPLHHAVDASNE